MHVSNVKGVIALQTILFVAPVTEKDQNLDPQPSQSLPTPLRINGFVSLLDGYDPPTVLYLSAGFRVDFRINYAGPQISFVSDNSSCKAKT